MEVTTTIAEIKQMQQGTTSKHEDDDCEVDELPVSSFEEFERLINSVQQDEELLIVSPREQQDTTDTIFTTTTATTTTTCQEELTCSQSTRTDNDDNLIPIGIMRQQQRGVYYQHPQLILKRLLLDNSLQLSVDHIRDTSTLRLTLQKLQLENAVLKDIQKQLNKREKPSGYVISDGRNKILLMDAFVRSMVGFTENEQVNNWEEIVERECFIDAHVKVLTMWINRHRTGELKGMLFHNRKTNKITRSSRIDIENYYDNKTGRVLICLSRVYF